MLRTPLSRKLWPLAILAILIATAVLLISRLPQTQDRQHAAGGNPLTGQVEVTREPVDEGASRATGPTAEAVTPEPVKPGPKRAQERASRVTAHLGTGLVVDAAKHPIAGARVHIVPALDETRELYVDKEPEEWLNTGLVYTTDERGEFPLDLVRNDVAHAIIARMNGFGWAFAVLEPDAANSPSIQLTLESTASLDGRVVDQEGNRLSGVRVYHNDGVVWDEWLKWPTAKALAVLLTREETTSEKDGHFSFHEVCHNSQEITAEAEGYATAWLWDIPPDSTVKLTMIPSAVVFGTVLDELGRPVPGAKVRTSTYGCIPEQTTPWIDCESDGSYQIDGAISGSAGVTAWTEHGYATRRVNLWIQPESHTQVDFVLKKEEMISGQLVDSRGQGVKGKRIVLYGQSDGYIWADLYSDQDGKFIADALPPGDTYRIWIKGGKEYGHRRIEGIPAGTENLTIRLYESGILWGTVTFDGEPATEVQIRLLPRKDLPGGEGMMAGCDAIQNSRKVRKLDIEGNHYTHHFWPGVYDIELRAFGYAPIRLQNIRITPGKMPRPIDLHFQYAEPTRGLVTDATSGHPIAGAEVVVLEDYYTGTLKRSARSLAVKTDDSGRFQITLPHTSDLCLEVAAADHAARTIRDVMARTSGGEPLEVALSAGGRVEGQVHTTYAVPSSTFEIVLRELGREGGLSTYVDDKGRFVFDHVPVGRVEVVANDWYYQNLYPDVGPQIRQVVVREGETARVEFDTASGVTLKGRVEGWNKPLLIEARKLDGGPQSGVAGASFTDREGRFRIPFLRPGRYRVGSTVGQPGYSIAVSAEVTIRAVEPEELRLEVPGGILEGTLRGTASAALPRAIITIENEASPGRPLARCLTDGEGRFAIGGISEGFYSIRARARGYATAIEPGCPVPGEAVQLTLQPEARMLVSVQDDRGLALPGADVAVQDSTEPALSRQAICGGEGSVLFAALQARTHAVSARLDGYLPADPLLVSLYPNQTRAVTVTLVRTGRIEVTVTDPDGKPLSRVSVVLMDEDGNEIATRTTAEKGTALFEDLAPGWYEIAAGPGQETSDAVEVLAGETAAVPLVIAD